MTELIERAPAKINLSLHVDPVKENGRHELNSLISFAGGAACDTLSATPAAEFSLVVEGPYAAQTGPTEDNLVLKAARALDEALEGGAPKLAFKLDKTLPCAAGMGGGSADAGAALRLIARAYGGQKAVIAAQAIAPHLGGDVLACFIGKPGLMRGEGEIYEPMASLPALPALLVNPGLPCPTGPVFGAYDRLRTAHSPHPLPSAAAADPYDLIAYLKAETKNDLEAPAISLVSEIGALLERLENLPGAKLARMSGSGATCFALFGDLAQAELAMPAFEDLVSNGGWCTATVLGAAEPC